MVHIDAFLYLVRLSTVKVRKLIDLSNEASYSFTFDYENSRSHVESNTPLFLRRELYVQCGNLTCGHVTLTKPLLKLIQDFEDTIPKIKNRVFFRLKCAVPALPSAPTWRQTFRLNCFIVF